MDKQIPAINLLKLLDNTDIGIVIHRMDTSIVYANPTALKLLRLSYNQMIGKDALDPQWHFLDRENNLIAIEDYPVNRVIKTGKPLHNEIIGVVDSQDKDISWFSLNAYKEEGSNEQEGFVIVNFSDITYKKQDFSFADILHQTQDVVIVTEADNIDRPFGPKIVYVNKAFETLTGYSADEVLGETPRLLQGKDTDPDVLARIRQALVNKTSCTEKVINYSKSGKPYWLELNILPLKNNYGDVTHFAAIERDVTNQTYYELALEQRNKDLKQIKTSLEHILSERTEALRQTNSKLLRLAHEDALTNLANRRSFLMQATQQLARSQRGKLMIGVAIVDIDNFKAINDRFGHDVGDNALILVADVLRQTFRKEDVFGRLGGEEFAVCLLAQSASSIKNSLCRLLEAVRHESSGEVFGPMTVSIGLYLNKQCNQSDISVMLKIADDALYQAKHNGRDQLVISE